MEFTTEYKDKTDKIIAMFDKTFTASEGVKEGQAIKELVTNMLASLGSGEMQVFSAVDGEDVLGCVIFTRMTYQQDARTVFILSPAAVSTEMQGKGLGQRLIRHALQTLRTDGVQIALAYGDVNFYSKIGFRFITEADARAPFPLEHPEGWLGQSLDGSQFKPLTGSSQCVPPLDDPNLW